MYHSLGMVISCGTGLYFLENTIEPPRSEGVGFALRRCDRRSDTEAGAILQFECEPSDIMSIIYLS